MNVLFVKFTLLVIILLIFSPYITHGKMTPPPEYKNLSNEDKIRVDQLVKEFERNNVNEPDREKIISGAISILMAYIAHKPRNYYFSDRSLASVVGNSIFVNGVDITGNSGNHITNNTTYGDNSPILNGENNLNTKDDKKWYEDIIVAFFTSIFMSIPIIVKAYVKRNIGQSLNN